MLGSEPLAGTITERPTGITFAGGFAVPPTRGWSARVNWPGRVVAHDQPHVVAQLLERRRLQLRVLDNRPPERPRERDDDPDLHGRTYGQSLRKTGTRACGFRSRDQGVRYGRCVATWALAGVILDLVAAAATSRSPGCSTMRLDGIHHVTCITGDAPRNVDFYTRVLGLRMVKKTVNQDDPTVYHLFYADDEGSAGSDITFFEYPGARRGRAGDGMVHRSTGGWLGGGARLLGASASAPRAEVASRADGDGSRFEDPEGLRHELAVVDDGRRAARRRAPGDPGRARAPGLRRRARICSATRTRAARCSRTTLGFDAATGTAPGRRAARAAVGLRLRRAAGRARARRRGHRPPRRLGLDDGGPRGLAPSASPTPAARRRRSSTASGSARSTSASRAASSSRSRRSGPASRSTRIAEHLGESLVAPARFEHLREQIEPVLTPLPDPRAARTR